MASFDKVDRAMIHFDLFRGVVLEVDFALDWELIIHY